uniref:Uncharacterized protein n=1 Tax=Rhizophora mucronata TaxID=61149 RepID=A0A2P2PVT7_RHIMU
MHNLKHPQASACSNDSKWTISSHISTQQTPPKILRSLRNLHSLHLQSNNKPNHIPLQHRHFLPHRSHATPHPRCVQSL